MRIAFILIAISLSGCSAKRVLVRDCQDLQGMGDTKNCELIKEL